MRTFLQLAALLALSPPAAFATVSINLTAGVLSNASGAAVPDGSLVQLLSSGPNLGFSALGAGSFTSGDDILLASFAMDSTSTGLGGAVNKPITISLAGGIAAGQTLEVRWFPTLASSASAASLVAGTPYGQFTGFTLDGLTTGSSVNTIPTDGGAIGPEFLTQSTGSGANAFADVAGQSTLVVSPSGVPEPSAWALLGGAAALAAALRRRRPAARA